MGSCLDGAPHPPSLSHWSLPSTLQGRGLALPPEARPRAEPGPVSTRECPGRHGVSVCPAALPTAPPPAAGTGMLPLPFSNEGLAVGWCRGWHGGWQGLGPRSQA